jgi:hypothetical protein
MGTVSDHLARDEALRLVGRVMEGHASTLKEAGRWELRAILAGGPGPSFKSFPWVAHQLALDKSVAVRKRLEKRTDLLPYQRSLLGWQGKCNPALRVTLEKSYWLFDSYNYRLSEDPLLPLYDFIETGKSSRATWTWLLSEKAPSGLRYDLVENCDKREALDLATLERLSRDPAPIVRAGFLAAWDAYWWPLERQLAISLDGFAEQASGLPFMPDISCEWSGPRSEKRGESYGDPPDFQMIRYWALEVGWAGTFGELLSVVRSGSLS